MNTRELRVEHDMEADFEIRREVEEIQAELLRLGRLRRRRRIRDRDGVSPKLRSWDSASWIWRRPTLTHSRD